MKVLHVLNELKFSGAEIMYADAASVFQNLGCELIVVNTAETLGEFASNFARHGYTVLHLPYPSTGNALSKYKYCKSFIKMLKDQRIDVVHIHRSDIKHCMARCAYLAGCKSVYTFHSVFKSRRITYLYHLWLRWSMKHLYHCQLQSISDSVYDNEKNYYHNKTTKIYNWYGSNRIYPAVNETEKIEVRKELGIDKDTLVLISIGGCSPIKRHSEIIKALPSILKLYPNAIYLHLGNGTNISEEQQLATTLNVDSNIQFCGNQADVRKYLIASDIYIMTSKFEGISITTIEAMACNIPAVLYDVPGLRDFNSQNECCELIPEDYNLLAETVVRLYNDKSRRGKLVKNASNLIHNNYDMKTNATKIFHLYCR